MGVWFSGCGDCEGEVSGVVGSEIDCVVLKLDCGLKELLKLL